MAIFTAYIRGWLNALSNIQLSIIYYMANLLFAIVAAYPLKGYLENTVGYSLTLNESLGDFDFTFLTDFMNEYGVGLSTILNQSFVLVLVFLVFSIFLTGGIIKTIAKKEKGHFWAGCGQYFGKLFILTLFFLALQASLFFLVFQGFQFLSGGLSPFGLNTDEDWVRAFQVVAPIYLFFATFLFMLQDYIKIHIANQSKGSILSATSAALKMVFRRIYLTLPLYLINLLTLGLSAYLYYLLRSSGIANVWILLILGQVFVFLRILLKVVNLYSIDYLYGDRD